MKTAYKALILPYTDDNEILIQDRSDMKKWGFIMKWGYFGGSIEQGETPVEAVIRETYEELTLKVIDSELTFIGIFTDQPRPDKKIVRHAYLYKLNTPLEKLDLQEGKAMKLFPSAEVDKLMILEADQKLAKKAHKILINNKIQEVFKKSLL